jgi:chloramphenicol 3-O-phosphotransferase
MTSAHYRLVHVSHAAYGNGVACNGGGCPAIYATPQGSYVIIGRRLSNQEKAGLPMDVIEDALEVPRELLMDAGPKLIG